MHLFYHTEEVFIHLLGWIEYKGVPVLGSSSPSGWDRAVMNCCFYIQVQHRPVPFLHLHTHNLPEPLLAATGLPTSTPAAPNPVSMQQTERTFHFSPTHTGSQRDTDHPVYLPLYPTTVNILSYFLSLLWSLEGELRTLSHCTLQYFRRCLQNQWPQYHFHVTI